MMGSITLDDIDAAEGAVKNIRVKLQLIGRTIYQMRNGEELGPKYGFDGYVRGNFAGSNYYDQEGPDWGVGTPILSLLYYWPRAENKIVVTLPQGWLGRDWATLESERLAVERAEVAEKQRIATEERKAKTAATERATFERLRAKYQPEEQIQP